MLRSSRSQRSSRGGDQTTCGRGQLCFVASARRSLIRPHGRLVVYGVFDGLVPLDFTAVTLGELEVVGVVGSPGTYPLGSAATLPRTAAARTEDALLDLLERGT